MTTAFTTHTLTLTAKEQRSQHLLRLWFSYENPKQYQSEQLGDYLKLVFPNNSEKPLLRTFTVAEMAIPEQQIAIDFVVHGEVSTPSPEQGGYAHSFAVTSRPGDMIKVLGPNTKQSIPYTEERTLFVADLTALPALNAILSRQQWQADVWLISADPAAAELLPQSPQLDIHVFKDLAQLEQTYASDDLQRFHGLWCAGEFQLMRYLRGCAKSQPQLHRDTTYFSSYWKQGVTEDGHKLIKRADNEAYAKTREGVS